MKSDQRLHVYAWEFPVRLTHWINFLCILTLAVTGFYIGHPFIHAYSADQYIMGWIRFIHFTAAYIFLMSLIIRIYWAFVGNKYANWRAFFPFTFKGLKDMGGALRYYLFLGGEAPKAVGHPALAGLTYLILFLLFVFEIFSGFALYSTAHEGGFIWTLLGGWLIGVMNLQTIRLYHHLAMYAILVLAMVHVYFAWHLDGIKKDGIMGSIFNGDKFIRPEEMRH